MKSLRFTSVRHAARHREDGFAMVLLGICMMLLLAVAAFALDVGAWYLRTSELQRASDAAALAGAAKMPDSSAAISAAKAIAQKNGFVHGGDITATFTPLGQDRFQATIKDATAPMYFSDIFIKNFAIARTSYAEFVDSVPMGSPFNALGMGDVGLGSVPTQNYWLAVNGYCLPKEDGDLFMAGFDGTVQQLADGTFDIACTKKYPGSAKNNDYLESGYDYIVEVPAGAGSVDINVYDGAFSSHAADPPSSGIRPNGGVSPDAAKGPNPTVTTTFRLWDTKGTGSISDDTIMKQVVFGTNDPAGMDKNYKLGTVTPPSGAPYKYRVQVFTKKGETNSVGVNAFGLSATPTSTGTYCDSRVSFTCPSVYGKNAISLFANLDPGSTGYVDLYLAKIVGSYAGKPLQVALWDPGERANSIELLDPFNNARTFTYTASPKPSVGSSGSTKLLDVSNSDVDPPGPNRSNRYIYNDRLVVMTKDLNTDYANNYGDGWWKLRYRVSSSITERATWSASVDNGDPVHLLRSATS